jgi:hypothetical protein
MKTALTSAIQKLYRLIYELFPNKIQKHELKEIYPDLEARFASHLINEPVQFDDAGFHRENVTPESLLHSYEVLQCQKCALYDCPHHSKCFCKINCGEKSKVACFSHNDPFFLLINSVFSECRIILQKTTLGRPVCNTTNRLWRRLLFGKERLVLVV